MKYFKIAISLVLVIFILVSCNREETFPEIELLPKPTGKEAYLNISFSDSSYFLQDSVDGFVLAASATTSAREDIEFPAWVGASFYSDSSLMYFNISNIYQRASKKELLYKITRSKQELAYITYETGTYNFQNYGFSVNIQEMDSVNALPRDYDSHKMKQADSAFFNVTDYYMGDIWFTIWLEGNFNVTIKMNGTSVTAQGEFFLEFPLWSTD